MPDVLRLRFVRRASLRRVGGQALRSAGKVELEALRGVRVWAGMVGPDAV